MRIENYKEQAPGTNILVTFDVYNEKTTWTYRQFKLMKNKKGGHFIAWPSFFVESENKWVQYYDLSQEKKKEFVQILKQELVHFMNGPGIDSQS